jgi:uncharacterized membrane protein YecN with MAPEG domain
MGVNVFAVTTHGPLIVVTPVVAAVLVLLIWVFGLRVTRLRRRLGVRFGDGGQPELQTAYRLHGNLVEHGMPLLVLLLIWEIQGASRVALTIAGATIVVSRLLHAFGFGARIRTVHVAGAALTYFMEATLSVAVLLAVFRHIP